MSISNTTHDYCYCLCAGRAIVRSRLATDSAPLTLPAAEAAQSQLMGEQVRDEKMSSSAGMVQIRQGVAEYDLPGDEEQACFERALETTRGGGRSRERGGERAWAAARVVSGWGRLPREAGGLPAGRLVAAAIEFWMAGEEHDRHLLQADDDR